MVICEQMMRFPHCFSIIYYLSFFYSHLQPSCHFALCLSTVACPHFRWCLLSVNWVFLFLVCWPDFSLYLRFSCHSDTPLLFLPLISFPPPPLLPMVNIKSHKHTLTRPCFIWMHTCTMQKLNIQKLRFSYVVMKLFYCPVWQKSLIGQTKR